MSRLIMLALALAAAPAPAFTHDFVLLAQAARVSLAQAVDIAKNRTGGQVLSAQSEGGSYLIKVLTPSGEVLIVRVDAQTGAVR